MTAVTRAGEDRPLSLTVVIPAYNEAAGIADTLARTCRFLAGTPWTWDVLVVDDGSADQTAAIVEAAGRAEPRVSVLREPHRGKGGAVRTGMLAARGDYRFLCDADLSMPIAELLRFLPPRLAGVDVAIATREGLGSRRVGEPWFRHLSGRVFNLAIQALVLRGLSDTQCGFKMFSAAAAEAIFPRVTLDGWAFDVEVLAIARHDGLRVAEVPIEWHYRHASRVSLLRDAGAMFADLLRIRRRWR